MRSRHSARVEGVPMGNGSKARAGMGSGSYCTVTVTGEEVEAVSEASPEYLAVME